MPDAQPTADPIDMQSYVAARYESSIGYYYAASRSNKKWYKLTRSLTIILGSLVTLISSISSASFIENDSLVSTLFAISTPVVAAVLTIVGGFSQSFHWGAAWRDMIINAQRLEKERDRFLATSPERRDFQAELDKINTLVIEETKSFFQRVLDSKIMDKMWGKDELG